MELRHLRYFIAVAETENVTRAAQKLHVSQPALSRQIRDLEDELGFSLFERSAKSVRLTTAGQTFLKESQAVLARTENAIQAARAVATGSGMEVHVGYATSPTAKIFPSILRSFQTEMPKARVKLHDLSTEEMLHRLKQSQIDVAFMVEPGPALMRGLNFEALTEEQMCLAVGRKHPLASKSAVKLADILQEPFIGLNRTEYPDYYEWFDDLFQSTRPRPKILEEHDSVSSLIASVEACTGVALVLESAECIAGNRLKFLRITPAPKSLLIGMAWPKKGKLKSATKTFLECAKRVSHSGAVTGQP